MNVDREKSSGKSCDNTNVKVPGRKGRTSVSGQVTPTKYRTGRLKQQKIFFSQFWKLGNPRSKRLQAWFLWGPSARSCCTLTHQRKRALISSSSKGTNPIMETLSTWSHPNLINSQRPYLQIWSHWDLRLQHIHLGGTQTFRTQQPEKKTEEEEPVRKEKTQRHVPSWKPRTEFQGWETDQQGRRLQNGWVESLRDNLWFSTISVRILTKRSFSGVMRIKNWFKRIQQSLGGEKLEGAGTGNPFKRVKELCSKGQQRSGAKLERNMIGKIRACLYVEGNERKMKCWKHSVNS